MYHRPGFNRKVEVKEEKGQERHQTEIVGT